MKSLLLSGIGALILSGSVAVAGDLSWSGRYRVEGVTIQNSNLDDSNQNKNYILHHLILQPKIVAADGIKIFGRFDILNNSSYPNSQVGQLMGDTNAANSCPASGNNAPGNGCSPAHSESQNDETLRVTEVYAIWNQEFSSLLVGRAPYQFGLGMSQNAGLGEFDHFMNTKDMVAYKIIAGNLSFMPAYGKIYEGDVNSEDDVTEYLMQVQYENPDTDLTMGLLYDVRSAPKWSNSPPYGVGAYGGAGAYVYEGWNSKQFNLFVKKKAAGFNVALEAGFQNGYSGVETTEGRDVNIQGFGIATELGWRPEGSLWDWDLKAGVASGDNPDSRDSYEGFFFHRNYDVALLLFNHFLGDNNFDVSGSKKFYGPSSTARGGAVNTVDTNVITNALYFAPGFSYHMSDRWSWKFHVIQAALMTPQRTTAEKDLGTEVDTGFYFKPHDHLTVGIDGGILFPGSAFTANLGYQQRAAYGLTTKAAISF